VRLITWNVAGRVTRLGEQAAALGPLAPDVVCLQEVTARTAPLWRDALAGAGLAHAATSLDAEPDVGDRRRPLAVLTAARAPLDVLAAPEVPWGERLLICRVDGVEIVNLHSPIAPSPGLAKVRTHEAVAEYLSGGRPPRILCGDLNTPRREHPDGDVMTFAYTSSGKLRPERGERWDAAERALVYGLRRQGWVDAFRALHGYEHREASWAFPNGGGWRLDHVLAEGLEPVAAHYEHGWRTTGLSDHSALVVDLRPRAKPIVFDLDGVLVDTERVWLDVRRELTEANGGTWHDAANSAMQGWSTDEWTRYMAEDLGVRLTPDEIYERVTRELDRRYRAEPPFLPGALETVRALHAEGRTLAVASSSPQAIIDALLEAGDVADRFAAVVSSEAVERGKPSPDVYLEAARRLGADPAGCVAVEDSTNGLRAAAAAGMEVLALPNVHDPPDPEALALATRVASSLPDLFG
jgi:HAD superfamily hydrolase (TIGR01509 family)